MIIYIYILVNVRKDLSLFIAIEIYMFRKYKEGTLLKIDQFSSEKHLSKMFFKDISFCRVFDRHDDF